ncbi:MAG: septal ring lytic transglycosylase RlpA family protein [Ignavibacteriae bacterium]|nr:septal ring lytic transglycosylase RlpA family protein [Ignavibacteriota bacterium]
MILRTLIAVVGFAAAAALSSCSSGYTTTRSNTSNYEDELDGVASYYADEFHGRKTSSGEIYDMHALTAAHRTLPFNSIVRVTNLDNNRSVEVRINDRGPFKSKRVIDLSYRAALEIGLIANGTAPVLIEVLELGQRSGR